MAFITGNLYDALRSAGAEDEKARKAAEDVVGFENRIGSLAADASVLKRMVGFNLALTLAMVGKLVLSGQ